MPHHLATAPSGIDDSDQDPLVRRLKWPDRLCPIRESNQSSRSPEPPKCSGSLGAPRTKPYGAVRSRRSGSTAGSWFQPRDCSRCSGTVRPMPPPEREHPADEGHGGVFLDRLAGTIDGSNDTSAFIKIEDRIAKLRALLDAPALGAYEPHRSRNRERFERERDALARELQDLALAMLWRQLQD